MHGEYDTSKYLTIQGWRSYDLPLYNYKKDNYLVLWLKENNNEYVITDLNWHYCVPSLWGADENETAYNIVNYQNISLKEIEGLIADTFTKKQ